MFKQALRFFLDSSLSLEHCSSFISTVSKAKSNNSKIIFLNLRPFSVRKYSV